MELPAKTSPGRRWCLSAASGSPGMPRPGDVKGRAPPPLPRRRNQGTDQGPVFRCAFLPRSGPIPARDAAPPARPRPRAARRAVLRAGVAGTARDGRRCRKEAGDCPRSQGPALLPAALGGPEAASERGLQAELWEAAAV